MLDWKLFLTVDTIYVHSGQCKGMKIHSFFCHSELISVYSLLVQNQQFAHTNVRI